MLRSDEILQRLDEGVYDPSIFKAVFVFGGPGSGKTYVAKKTTGGHGLKYLSSDEVLEYLFKLQGLDISKMSPEEIVARDPTDRKWAQWFRDKKKTFYLEGRLGLIIDGTGANYDKIRRQVQHLRSLGYDCYGIFVYVTPKTALKRNAKRDRRLPDDIVIEKYSASARNMFHLQELFTNERWDLVINEEPNSKFEIVWKKVMKWVKEPPKNPIAKYWIKSELKKRGINVPIEKR
jgi:dephospho-CoA kinase